MIPVSISFRGIRGRRNFADLARRVEQSLQRRLQRVGREIQQDFEKTTSTWTNKPSFVLKQFSRGGDMVVRVSTDDEIYKFVNNGTRRHPIPKSGTAHLVFQWGGPGSYKAKTRPRVIGSRSGGPSGPIVHRKRAVHPGTEAREFDKAIRDKTQKKYPAMMVQAVKGAIAAW